MPLFKWTFFYKDAIDNGMSFNLYRNESFLNLYGSTPNPGTNLITAMAPLLGTGVRFHYLRNSRDDLRGDGSLFQLSNIAAYSGDPAKPMEQAGSCILLSCTDATFQKKKAMYIHGVWDTAISSGSIQTPPTWATKRDAFFSELKNGWGWKTVASKVNANVTACVLLPSGKLQVTFDDDIFLPEQIGFGAQIQMSGMDTVPKMRNPVVFKPSTARIGVTRQKFGLTNFIGATAIANRYGFQPIIQCYFIRPVTHKVGRVFRPSAGGRSRR